MSGRRSLAAIIVGAIVALIGLVLAVGGTWLAIVGGSPYYLVTGMAMILAGWLLVRGRMAGVWLYAAIVALTVVWAFGEVGANGWALVPRIVAPIVLLVAVLLAAPTLTRAANRWRLAGGGIVAVVALTAIVFVAIGAQPWPAVAALPAGKAPGMSDPSGQTVGEDWPAYGGNYAARRYSALDQITPGNVGTLQRAWLFHTGDVPSTAKIAKTYGAETTPIKIGDTLFLCTPKNIVIALDPAAGREKWRFDPRVSDKAIPYTAACRGVVYYAVPGAPAEALCATRIIEGTLDARLIAVDARTGRPCSGFGAAGQVDAKIGMGPVPDGYVSINSPPTIVRGVLVTGHQVLDGQDRWAPSGVIQGFDAVTGRLRWAWDMMHPDWSGYPPAGQTWARGTPNMWTMTSGDEQLGLVYLPMGNAAADYYSGLRRPAENFYATSLVALDVTTGKPRWRFQAVKKDVWDYDFGGQGTLIDWPVAGGGGTVPAMALPSKQGDIYILDRRTGRPLTPIGTVRAPGGGVEPAQRPPTQIVSLWHNLRKPVLTERDMWGMSPIDQMICRIQFRQASYKGFFTPPEADRRSITYPGYNGGTDWGGIAVDPVRGVIVANYNDMPNYTRLVPRAKANKLGWAPRDQARGNIGGAEGAGDPQAHTPYAVDVNAGWRMKFTGMLCKQPPYGGIQAIDLRTGKTIWDRPLGTARTNGPFGIPSMLPLTIGTPNNGGSVVTAGGLIFVAAATDNLIRAIDLRTGKVLWSDVLPGGGQATPMIYRSQGRDYLVIMAGGHHFMETPVSDALVAYALPQRR